MDHVLEKRKQKHDFRFYQPGGQVRNPRVPYRSQKVDGQEYHVRRPLILWGVFLFQIVGTVIACVVDPEAGVGFGAPFCFLMVPSYIKGFLWYYRRQINTYRSQIKVLFFGCLLSIVNTAIGVFVGLATVLATISLLALLNLVFAGELIPRSFLMQCGLATGGTTGALTWSYFYYRQLNAH